MQKIFNIIIGIDPDIKSNGVAFVHDDIIELYNMPFWDLFHYIKNLAAKSDGGILIVIEHGEQNKAIFTAKNATNRAVSAKIGSSVGKNFAISQILIELCEMENIPYKKYVPHSMKWRHEYVKNNYSIYKRTNQDQRDALRAAIAFKGKKVVIDNKEY